MLKTFGLILIGISIILQITGGVMDILDKDKMVVSKSHIFADSLYLLVFGFAFLFLSKNNKNSIIL